jgi:zinc-ribbon domain
MVCHQCGKPVEPGQRFCGGCGASLRNVTDPTAVVPAAEPAVEPVPEPAADDEWSGDDPVWAATGAIPLTAPAETLHTSDLPATQPLTPMPPPPGPAWTLDDLPDAEPVSTVADPVWAGAAEGYAPQPTTTMQMPTVPAAVPPRESRLRWSAVTVFGVLMAVAALLGSFTVAVGVESDARLVPTDSVPAFRTGTWYLDDFADNLSIAVLIAALAAVVGGLAAAFRWRWGSGLAGGAGLAMAGLGALAVGLAQLPLQAARDFAAIPNPQTFTLTLTTDIGYWLLVGAAAIGVMLFFASLNEAFGDRRPGLNPWIAALGALATVVAVIGPMLPEGTAVFTDNWYRVDGIGSPPALLLLGRLVQLGVLLLVGVVGYLSVRRWGLALVVGGTLPIIWLAVSALFDLTNNPVGPAYRNPGADGSDLHGVTIIGFSAVIAMTILALVAAYDQTTRERH